jgi:hypothetical protein
MEALSVLQNFERILDKKKLASVTSSKKTEGDTENDHVKLQQLISIVKYLFDYFFLFSPDYFKKKFQFKLKCYFSLNTTRFSEKEFKALSEFEESNIKVSI